MSSRIKICGVTRLEDARLAADLGADYLGLNFYPPSPRAIGVERATEIAHSVKGQVTIVGVFVNESPERIQEMVEQVPLDLVQLHGDESPAEVEAFGSLAIKVFRMSSVFDAAWLSEYPSVAAFLFDCSHPGLYGGTGSAWLFEQIADLNAGRPVLVAGGIRPDNVRQALERSGADGVDVCSGVEARPGIKDPEAMKRLFDEVRDAQDRP